jgi:hypothetical protein
MTFYVTLIRDGTDHPIGKELHFKVEAESAHYAVRIAGAYCKGLFEASGNGAEISSVSKTKSRGVEYMGL